MTCLMVLCQCPPHSIRLEFIYSDSMRVGDIDKAVRAVVFKLQKKSSVALARARFSSRWLYLWNGEFHFYASHIHL